VTDTATPALEIRGVAKRFGDVAALDGVDLVVRAGTVHALVGENGAGKSTLMRIAYGMLAADRGEVLLFGTRGDASVADAITRGAGMVHQHLSLVPNLTAAENLVLGGRGLYRPSDARALVRRVGDESGLKVDADARVSELSIVEQQRLEILKALAHGARLLILDEPTAVLAPSETEDLLRWIRAFTDRGGSVVLVTHKLKEALAVAHDVTVLRRGRVVQAGLASATSANELARAMFPDPPEATASPAAQRGDVVVKAENVTITDARGAERIRAASFMVHRGEIVGIAAIEGSGHRELLAALMGVPVGSTGSLALPRDVGVIPANRAREALVAEFSLTENVALRGLGRRRGLMPWSEIAGRTTRLIERFSIAAPSHATPARQLSGGNQQRLVVGRELEGSVDLVVADNPTRGLDLRATAFVLEQLRHAAAAGAAVVFHSSDLDELLGIASRVFVVFDGRVSESAPDREIVGQAMLGAHLVASA
jgi:simple sugar transport system ATP-binding protein